MWLARVIALSLGLAVGHPARIAMAARQKIDNVDPLVPSSVGRVEGEETRARSPRSLPWGGAVSDLFNEPRGDVLGVPAASLRKFTLAYCTQDQPLSSAFQSCGVPDLRRNLRL
jgi:hypothetical protein